MTPPSPPNHSILILRQHFESIALDLVLSLIQISHLLLWKFTDGVNITLGFDSSPYLNPRTVSLSRESFARQPFGLRGGEPMLGSFTCFIKCSLLATDLVVRKLKYQGKEPCFPFSSTNFVLSTPEKLRDVHLMKEGLHNQTS